MEIEQALSDYIGYLFTSVQADPAFPSSAYDWAETHIEACRHKVAKWEQSLEFEALVSSGVTPGPQHRHQLSGRRTQLRAFFRRSRAYFKILRRLAVSEEIIANYELCFAIPKLRSDATHLSALEDVGFQDDCLQFKTFTIRRMSRTEAIDKLELDVRRLFYPRFSSVVDPQALSYLWFIETTGPSKSGLARMLPPPEVAKSFTGLPQDVERAFSMLSLWDWENSDNDRIRPTPSDKTKGWARPSIAFILPVQAELRRLPSYYPPISEVEMEYSDDGDSRPVYSFSINSSDRFVTFITDREIKLESILAVPDWNFMQTALGFFTKAYSSEGIEQLIWHIVTIESLVGGDSNGLVTMMTRRIKNILGQAPGDRFKELYNIRSECIHGNAQYSTSSLFRRDLRDARHIARRLLLWFIDYMSKMAENCLTNITRGELLQPLDLDSTLARALRKKTKNLPRAYSAFFEVGLPTRPKTPRLTEPIF